MTTAHLQLNNDGTAANNTTLRANGDGSFSVCKGNPGAETEIAKVSAAGVITATSATFSGQLIGGGTATNDSAGAGVIGQFLTSGSVGPTSLSTNTAKTVASITLTAGDWDVSSGFVFTGPAGTNLTVSIIAINTTTDTLPGGLDARLWSDVRSGGSTVYATMDLHGSTAPLRYSVASSTTLYLIAYQTFTVSTSTCTARISARRVR